MTHLPHLVGELADAWQVAVGEPFGLSYNYAAAAHRSGGVEAVLKVSLPGRQLALEAQALRCYDGAGACRLLAHDPARRALLPERLRPGEVLSSLAREDDEAATRTGARVVRRLWRPVPDGGFARHRAMYGGSGPLPAALFDSAPVDVLLHGDFHQYNVLSAERERWLAIDSSPPRTRPLCLCAERFLHSGSCRRLRGPEAPLCTSGCGVARTSTAASRGSPVTAP